MSPSDPHEDASSEPTPPDLQVEGLSLRHVFEEMSSNQTDTPDASPADAVPRQFGKYELIRILAEGGTGVVWEARELEVNRRLALKIMRAGSWVGEDAVSRFIAEAEVVSHLEHQHITPIYSVGEIEGTPYLAMPLYTQGSLGEHLTRIRSDLRQVARIVAAVADAIQHAHDRNILHRDLKPSNILLNPDDEPLVADFGLGRNLKQNSKLTSAGAVLGSLVYLSPETLTSAEPTAAVDLYGLGTILYELITGQPPYAGEHVAEILSLIGNQDPVPPAKLNPTLDRDLATICSKCLAREPGDRYATAQAVADDLRRWLEFRPVTARPVSLTERASKWVRRNRALAALFAIVPLGTVLALTIGHSREQQLDKARAESLAATSAATELDRRQRFDTIENRLSEGRQREAIAGLTALLRENPADIAAVARLQQVFFHRRFALPLMHAVDDERTVVEGFFSPEADHILMLGAEGGFKVQSFGATDGVWQSTDTLYVDARIMEEGGTFRLISNDGEITHWSLDDLSGPIATIPLQAVEESREWTGPRPDVRRLRQHVVADGRSPFRRGQLFRSGGRDPSDITWRIRATWGPHGDLVTAWPFQSTSLSTYDTSTGEPITRKLPLGVGVLCADFAPDGTQLWSGDPHGRLTLWGLDRGEILSQSPSADGLPLTHILASPDNRLVAARALDRRLWIYDSATQSWHTTPSTLPAKAGAFGFNSSGTELAISFENGQVHILNPTSLAPVLEPITSTGLATSLSYARNRDQLFMVMDTGQVEVWDTTLVTARTRTWPSTQPLLGDTLLDPTGNFAVLATRSQLTLLDLTNDPTTSSALVGDESSVVRSLALNPDRTQLVAALTNQATMELVGWQLPGFQPQFRESYDFAALDVRFAADGETLLTFDPQGQFRALRPTEPGTAKSIPTQPGANTPRTISADGSRVALISPAGNVEVRHTATMQRLVALSPTTSPVTQLLFAPSADALYVALLDGTVQRWTWSNQQPIAGPSLVHASAIAAMVAAPNGDILYTGTQSGVITVWKPLSETQHVFSNAPASGIRTLALDSTEQWLAVAAIDGSARIWHAASGLPVTSHIDFGDSIDRLRWDAPHERLLAITRDATVHAFPFAYRFPALSPNQLAVIESAVELREDADGVLRPVAPDRFQEMRTNRATRDESNLDDWWAKLTGTRD
ncbi:MAG: hypothetical protein SynsKO_08750 [Synoicihabitans sp.]